jgi:hypothetical protein
MPVAVVVQLEFVHVDQERTVEATSASMEPAYQAAVYKP